MATTKPIVPDQVNVITLKCARQWHKDFRHKNKNQGFAAGEFPMSLAIPFADIEQIVNDFNKDAGVTINGLRLYFVIKPGGKEGKPSISGIVVPTHGPLPNPEGEFHDMIVPATLRPGAPEHKYCHGVNPGSDRRAMVAVNGGDDDGEYASIYDVIRPCPPYCDPESPVIG